MRKTNNKTFMPKDRAIELLRKPGSRLMLLHGRHGLSYYVVPGGPLLREDAEAIIRRPDVRPFEDGLFPQHPPSWKIQ